MTGGTVKNISAKGIVMRDSEGVPIRMLGINFDITERKSAEKTQRLLSSIVESSEDAIISKNLDGTILSWNGGAQKIYGYSADEVVGKPISLLVPPNMTDEIPVIMERLKKGETVRHYETDRIRKDGNLISVSITISPLHDDAEKIIGAATIARDITDHKQKEERDRLARVVLEHLNQMVNTEDTIRDIVLSIKQSTGFDAVGLRIRKELDFPYFVQHGFSTDFLLTENTLTVQSPEGRRCREKECKIKLECTCGLVISGHADLANPFFTPFGSFWTNNSVTLLDLPADRDPRLYPRNRCIHEGFHSIALIPLRIGKDIVGLLQLNDRRKDQFTLEKIHSFEVLCATIGSTIARKRSEEEKVKLAAQLRQSQKMDAIGTLAGGVAHDFNNVLTAIIGFGRMAQKRVKEDKSTMEFIEEILDSAHSAAELTHSLLAFSRKETINVKIVDLNDIVMKINKMLLRVIGEDIKLTIMPLASELTIMADAGQLEMVLLNLATNARDAMPGGGELTIHTGMVDVDRSYAEANLFENTGMYAVLTVSDTGSGMDHDTMDNIFEPFFTTKEVGKGTGLGLSMVYGTIKQHNGNINVNSEPGKGTTFRIYLPMITDTEEAEREAARPAPLGRGETILLAEDDTKVRKITRMSLEEYGYKVIEAENGEEAIRRFLDNKDTISIVLLDVIMPLRNGKDAYEEIRKLDPAVKAIFMSGYSDDIISRQGVLQEGFDFIPKPINPDTLMRTIRDALDR